MTSSVQKSRLALEASTLWLLLIGVVQRIVTQSGPAPSYPSVTELLLRSAPHVAFAIVSGLIVLALRAKAVETLSRWALLVALILILLPWMPGLGQEYHGATRWISVDLGIFRLVGMPVVCIPVLLVLWCASDGCESLFREICRLAVIALFASAAALESLGMGLIILASGTVTLYASGVRFHLMAASAMGGLTLAVAAIAVAPYRLRRITAFLDPFQDPQGAGYHLIESMRAFSLGGIAGAGIDNTVMHYGYLPAVSTDFVYASVAEAWGVLGCSIVISLFIVLCISCLQIARHCTSQRQSAICIGMMSFVLIQAILNIWMNIGLVPIVGIGMPFVSAGGTSMIVCCAAVGLVLGIARQIDSRSDSV